MRKQSRVFITGMGVISPVGNDVTHFYKNLTDGKNGIDFITHFDASTNKVKLAAEVKDFNVNDYLDKKEARRMDRYCHFAVAAAEQAISSSRLVPEQQDPYRCGVIVSSGVGGMNTYETEHNKYIEQGPGRVSPLFIPMMISNMAAGMISIKYKFKGANFCTVTACTSGASAIGEAFRQIKNGYLDIVITGGAEAAITPFSVTGFTNMTALCVSDNPNAASLPFDKRRDGFVMGEGAGILVLESEESAKTRNSTIIEETCGYGATADAYHITSPDPQGISAARAMTNALDEADITPEQIDYINAHGTGTPLNDLYETIAIKKAFGATADIVNISSTKSMTGHLLGAAGAVEAIACVMTIKNGIIPPTINYLEPDKDIDLNYTPNTAVNKPVEFALSNSLGFGGHNASLLFKKCVE
ncbi:MAG: beta-ketoacyl-ACP synthase II [Clostridiaceae bacterium]|nr:beta-ketoacyl-ACP synthase II [Clostridiaceae bacterium]